MNEPVKKKRTGLTQLILFVITFITTTLAGAEWRYLETFLTGFRRPFMEFFLGGLGFSIPLLLTLTVHEFGHYFTAKRNNLEVSLPYYIPMYFFGIPGAIGTMGAFIRIREAIRSRKVIFDVGIAGPLAGFVIALGVLFYGFTHLPPPEHVYEAHPEYLIWGDDYADIVYELDSVILKSDLTHLDPAVYNQLPDTMYFSSEAAIGLGNSLLFSFFENYVASNPEWVPNHYETIHYPWLFAGYLALFFTALNLLPIGQLDGGHILFGLIGEKQHKYVSGALFLAMVFYGGLGVITPQSFNEDTFLGLPAFIYKPGLYLLFLYYMFYTFSHSPRERLLVTLCVFVGQFLLATFVPDFHGNVFWLVFGFLIGRFLGVFHPPVLHNKPLDWKRKVLGWLALVIFVLSFSPQVFIVG